MGLSKSIILLGIVVVVVSTLLFAMYGVFLTEMHKSTELQDEIQYWKNHSRLLEDQIQLSVTLHNDLNRDYDSLQIKYDSIDKP